MAKVPFPCCCSPVAGCADYYSPTQWEFEVSDLVGSAEGYANAQYNSTVGIWWYWDATTAIAALNAFAHQFYFVVGDIDGPGTIEGSAATFVLGHRRLEDTLTLSISPTLYAANGTFTGGSPDPKPAELSFTPYVFTLSNWAAVVSIRENINTNVRARIGQLSLYADIATDPLPGTLGQLGTPPTYGFATELAGKYHLLDLTTSTAVANCGQPIRLDIRSGSLAIGGFRYTGWRNIGTGSLTTAIPWDTQPPASLPLQRGALQHAGII